MIDSKLILLGGFGRSGTTGIRELLRGHPDITSSKKSEFRMLTDPGGLISLKNVFVDNWTFWRGDHAIHEFNDFCKNLNSKWFGGYALSNFKVEFYGNFEEANKQLLDHLVLSSYNGIWGKHANIFNKSLSWLLNKKRLKLINRKIYITDPIDYSQFKKFTRDYFNTLIKKKLHNEGASMYILDEPFISQNPKECIEITGANKLIIVLRDPRDVFQSFQGRDWSPKEKKHSLILLKSVYSYWLKKKKQLPEELYFELKFEDIANDFSKTYNELCLFLNIKHIPNILSQTNFNFKKAHIGRWKHELSMEEQEDMNNYFSELLALLGYQ